MVATIRTFLVVVFLACTVLGSSGLLERGGLALVSLTGTVAAALLIYLSYRKRHAQGIDATLMTHEPQDRTASIEAIDRD